MSLPRMGQAIIINNVAAEMPGSLADVEALQAAYKNVGFHVSSYSDCTIQVSAYVATDFQSKKSYGMLRLRAFLCKVFEIKFN